MSELGDLSSGSARQFVDSRLTKDTSWGELFDIYEQAHALTYLMSDYQRETYNDFQVLEFLGEVIKHLLTQFENNNTKDESL